MIGDRIIALLIYTGTTIEELSKSLMVDRTTVSSWINGHSDIRLIDYLKIFHSLDKSGRIQEIDRRKLWHIWVAFSSNDELQLFMLDIVNRPEKENNNE